MASVLMVLSAADHWTLNELVFYPGGHGPTEDLAYGKTSGALLAGRLASGKPLLTADLSQTTRS